MPDTTEYRRVRERIEANVAVVLESLERAVLMIRGAKASLRYGDDTYAELIKFAAEATAATHAQLDAASRQLIVLKKEM